jgi:hypothetical protein
VSNTLNIIKRNIIKRNIIKRNIIKRNIIKRNIIKRNIIKRNILTNTNKTSLLLSLLLQLIKKKIKLCQYLASKVRKINKNNKLDFSKRLNLVF